MKPIEYRHIINLRATDDRTIRGTSIVFNKESQLLGDWFTELILPGAVDQALINSCDILMLYNHDERMIPLARSKKGKGSLSINITPTGVDFMFSARPTPQGDEILYAVKDGDVDACSFAFRVAEDEWKVNSDGSQFRIIKKIESLHDFSIVNDPAYLDTSVRNRDKNIDAYYRSLEQDVSILNGTYYSSYEMEIYELKLKAFLSES